MSIEVQFVSKSYETQLALNEISFSAKKGEIIGFFSTSIPDTETVPLVGEM